MADVTRRIEAELLADLSAKVAEQVLAAALCDAKRAQAIGDAVASGIARDWGGQNVYIPMDLAAQRAQRNAQILERYTGDNVSQLVVEFRLSEQAIYRIIAAERDRVKAEREASRAASPPKPKTRLVLVRASLFDS